MSSIKIEPMEAADWPAVRAIYLEGIATGNATLEMSSPEWEKWDRDHLRACRLVARREGEVAGWAVLSPVSGRCVYAGVAEASVYVGARNRGQGIGASLLAELISASEREGIWTIEASIFPENAGSLALFRKAGFRDLGTRERLGAMNGVWRDVALLERRSKVVGV
jgi:L-amino acid N-acyltransferase YncA